MRGRSTIVMMLALAFTAAACRPNREKNPPPIADDGAKIDAAKVDPADPLAILSEPARSVILKSFPGARVGDAHRNKSGLPIRFTVTLHHDGDDYEVVVSQKGKILEVSKEIDLTEAPAAVRAAVAQRYPNARINDVYHVKEYASSGLVESISLEITINNVDREVTFDLLGRFISEEPAK